MRKILVPVLFLLMTGVVAAEGFEKGDNEVAFRLSYSDTDFGSASGGFDIGSTETTDISLTYGWLLTSHSQVGLLAGYNKLKIDGGDIFLNESIDGTRIGGFYTYNFNTNGSLIPYVGASISSLGGDLGDSYNLQYGAEIGLKIYPFKHGGFSVGLGYSSLSADTSGIDDADDISLGAGLLLRY